MESYDPVLNPVLNREVRRTGGRVLITLGDQDIDLSPSFVIFLSTRDPTVSKTKAVLFVEMACEERWENFSLFPVTGWIPTGSLLSCYICELHSNSQQLAEPVSEWSPESWKTRCWWKTLWPPQASGYVYQNWLSPVLKENSGFTLEIHSEMSPYSLFSGCPMAKYTKFT